MSFGPATARSRLATLCSTRSPARWPWASLIALNRSQSTSTRVVPAMPPLRWRCSTCSEKPRRLVRPVSSSVRVSTSVWFSRCAVERRVSSAFCRSWLRRRRRAISACSLQTTRMIALRRNCASSCGSRAASRSNSRRPSSSSTPSPAMVASALRAWSPINRPSSPKNSRAPRRLPTRSSPKSRSTSPPATTNMLVPRSPRRNRACPASTRRAWPTCANRAYSAGVRVEATASSPSCRPASSRICVAKRSPTPGPPTRWNRQDSIGPAPRGPRRPAAKPACAEGGGSLRGGAFAVELLFLGAALQRHRRALPALDGLGDGIEVAGADLALVPDRGEPALGGGEFPFLQLDEGAHLPARIAVGELEHAVVQRVETGQGDELEPVAVGGDFLLELGDGGVVQVLLPVERRRAVVGQQLARVLRVDRLGEGAGELQVRLAGLAPDQVGVGRVGEAARDRLLQALVRLVEPLRGALACAERPVVVVHVGRQQVGGLGVGAGDDQGGHAAHVRGQARGDQFLDRLAGRHQHLAAHVAALLHRGQLVLEVHA